MQTLKIENILPVGMTVVSGQPFTGKSLMALHLAMSVADGVPYLDAYAPTKGKAIYFTVGDSERRLADRINMIADDFDLSDLGLYLATGDADDKKQFHGILEEEKDLRLLILDPAPSLSPTPSMRTKSDYRWLEGLRALALERRMSLVLVTPFEPSTAVRTVADAVWILDRNHMEKSGSLFVSGPAVREQKIALRFESCRWSVSEPVEQSA